MHAHDSPRRPVFVPIAGEEGSEAFRSMAAVFQMVAAVPMHVNGAYRATVLPLGRPWNK